MLARFGLLMALVAGGCGPTVGAESTDSGASSTDAATSDGTALGGSTTLVDSPPGTTTHTEDTGAVDESTTGVCVPPPEGRCDPWANSCCPGDKCVPWADDGGNVWNELRCSPVAPEPHTAGSPCTVERSATSGLDDCDATSYCWSVDPETLEGECAALCQGSPSEPVCPEGQGCYIANDGVLTLCFDRCDPSAPTCNDGEECIPTNDDYLCIETVSTGKAGPGTPCDAPFQCYPDFVCTDAATYPGCGGPGCCTPYCNGQTEQGQQLCADIDPALACVLLPPEEQPPGIEHLGSCQLP